MGGAGARYLRNVLTSLFFGSLRPRDYDTAKGAGTRLKKSETQFLRVGLGGPHPWGRSPHCPILYNHKAEHHKGLRSWEDGVLLAALGLSGDN